MVYSGKPSTGCYLCRRRKIKCDEGRPGCRNCEIYGKQCPGYRPAIVINDRGYSKRRLLQGSKRFSNINNDDTTTLDPNYYSDLALIPRLLADASVDDRALCYFFDQYTTKRTVDDGLPHPALESIPLLYVLCRESEVTGNPSSCLRWAVEAAALTSFAHETNDQRLDLVARERYIMALHGLNEALSAPMENVQDATLATILLLVIFEDINGERAELVSSHTAGLELVARYHTYKPLDEKYRCIFDFAFVQLQIQIIGLGGRPRLNLQFLVDLLDHSDPLQSLMIITTKLCQLVVDMRGLQEDCHVNSAEFNLEDLTRYLLHAQSLDEQLSQWCQSVPQLWLPRLVYSTTGEPVITYPSISTGSVWNFYRCARMILRGKIDVLTEEIIAMNSMSAGNDSNSCWPLLSKPAGHSTRSDIVQDMIVDICRSIPFLLGDVDSSGRPSRPSASPAAAVAAAAAAPPHPCDFSRRLTAIEGYDMLWPFWHVLQSRFSTPKQRMQVQEVLHRLDQDFGIRLASKLADINGCSRPHQV